MSFVVVAPPSQAFVAPTIAPPHIQPPNSGYIAPIPATAPAPKAARARPKLVIFPCKALLTRLIVPPMAAAIISSINAYSPLGSVYLSGLFRA